MTWHYRTAELAEVLGAAAPAVDAEFSAVSTDTRTLEAGQVFFALKGERFDAAEFVKPALERGAAAVVTASNEQAASGRIIVVSDPLEALQRFAAWHRAKFTMPIFAITGSCGKTTTKDFLAALLATKYRVVKTQGNLNNEIGCPMTLLRLDADTQFAVIEMGANHVGEIARLCELARPTESAITMVAPAHLEGFGSIEDVARAKEEIARGVAPNGCFYVNVDNEWTRAAGQRYTGPKVYWGSHGDVVLRSQRFDEEGEMLLDIDPIGKLRLPLPIPAHAMNVTLAVAVALRHGVTEFEAPLREACRNAARFKVERIGPLDVLDDSYNANPASMTAALDALDARAGGGVRMAALGSMLELGTQAAALHREAGEHAARRGVTALFARGPHARDMIEGARAAGMPHAESLDDHAAIARAIHGRAQPGGVLLVKGSRGMKMELVIAALRELYGMAPTRAAAH